MQFTTQEMDPTTTLFEIEVEADQVKKAFERSYRNLGKHIRVPGFRPGQAPRAVLEQFVPEIDAKREASRLLIIDSLSNALKESDVTPYSTPQVELVSEDILETDPFKFKATVYLPPKVVLGDYNSLTAERLPQSVSDEEVMMALADVQRQLTEVRKVEDRSAQAEDRVTILIRSLEIEGHEPTIFLVVVGRSFGELDNQLVGMSPGDTKTAQMSFPYDFEDEQLAGKMQEVELTLKEIYEPLIPEIDEDLAKRFGHESVDAFKTHIKETLQREKDRMDLSRIEGGLLDQLRDISEVHVPKSLIEEQTKDDLEAMKTELKEQGTTLEQYLEANQITEEALNDQITEEAVKKLKNTFLILEIARSEKITVKESDVTAEIHKVVAGAGLGTAEQRDMMKNDELRRRVFTDMLLRKASQWLLDRALNESADDTVESTQETSEAESNA